jgi:spermidine synthase
VPAFGEWGFVLGTLTPYRPPSDLPRGLRFLNPRTLAQMFEFPADMGPVPAEVNRLNDQVLVRYYDQEWSSISH